MSKVKADCSGAKREQAADAAVDEPISVMIVDDSAIVRGLLTRSLSADPSLQVVSSAANGQVAIQQMKERPVDIVVLDIEMPVMDGLTALPLLLQANPQAKIIVASSLTTRGAEVALKALAAGAADFVPKPSARLEGTSKVNENAAFRQTLVAKIINLGRAGRGGERETRSALARPSKSNLAQALVPRSLAGLRPEVVAIASSAGGPVALTELLGRLRERVTLPVLITQHMPSAFTPVLAQNIERNCRRPCREARNGEPVMSGQTYIAPGGFHMIVETDAGTPLIRLSQDPPENFCRPAADPMFRSIAQVYGAGALGIVLTGIGCDGTAGGRAIVERGGAIIAQDEASSVAWGMPGSVVRAGLCSAVLSLDGIADRINTFANGGNG